MRNYAHSHWLFNKQCHSGHKCNVLHKISISYAYSLKPAAVVSLKKIATLRKRLKTSSADENHIFHKQYRVNSLDMRLLLLIVLPDGSPLSLYYFFRRAHSVRLGYSTPRALSNHSQSSKNTILCVSDPSVCS